MARCDSGVHASRIPAVPWYEPTFVLPAFLSLTICLLRPWIRELTETILGSTHRTMTDAEHSHSWSSIEAKDNARVHNGHVYHNQKSPADRLIESLKFPGMDRYHERPLETYKDTYEWIFDDSKIMHSCQICTDKVVAKGSCEECEQSQRCQVLRDMAYQCRQVTEYNQRLFEEAEKFRSWLRASKDIFWINGKAGSGKSCLMKFLLEHAMTREILCRWAGQDVTVVGFFFWAAGSELEKSHIGLLRGLVYQILRKQPKLADTLLATGEDLERPWSISRLRKALASIVSKVHASTSFMLFIDGLDEFQGDSQDLFSALDALNQSTNVKICVSSRPWNVFEDKYGRRGRELQLRLHDLTGLDIDAYIRGRLIDDLGLQDTTLVGEESHDLVGAIRGKAQGVFLWVYLTVKSLRRSAGDCWNYAEMLASLVAIPPELEILIGQIFDSIHPTHRRLATRTFLLLLESKHTIGQLPLLWLSMMDNSVGDIDCGQDDKMTEEQYQERIQSADQTVRKWCKDLVDVIRPNARNLDYEKEMACNLGMPAFVNDFILFSHRTIYDFITAKEKNGVLAELAGDSFCPSFTLCSIMVELVRCLHPRDVELVELGALFVQQSRSVITDLQGLTELTWSLHAFGQASTRRTSTVNWYLGYGHQIHRALGFSKDSEGSEEEGLTGDMLHTSAVFADFVLSLGAFRLFGLLFHSNQQMNNVKSKQIWLGTLLLDPGIRHGFPEDKHYGADRLDCISMLLEHGADPNKPIRTGSPRRSAWRGFLLMLHSGPGKFWFKTRYTGDRYDRYDMWILTLELIDKLLIFGADPDVDLDLEHLYTFLETSTKTRSASRDSTQAGDTDVAGTRPEIEYPTEAEKLAHLGLNIQNEESAEGFSRTVSATAAFELPISTARYLKGTHKPAIEECFPIVKAKLIAASEAKAATMATAAADAKADQVAKEVDQPTWMMFDLYL